MMFSISGLDKDFKLVSMMRFTNLQWNRKYHEAGSFEIEMPAEWNDMKIAYIYTPDRPETGRITKRRYYIRNGKKFITLSGHFLERDLNRMVVYPLGTSRNLTGPTWNYREGPAETVATQYFNAFKTIGYSTLGSGVQLVQYNLLNDKYPITAATSKGRGHTARHFRNGEYLADKLYWILKPSGMSFRVNYDFVDDKIKFSCIEGKDCTFNNKEHNNPVIFSTSNGTVINPDVVIDETDYKNSFVAVNTQTEEEYNTYTIIAGSNSLTPVVQKAEGFFKYVEVNEAPSDYTKSDYQQVLNYEGLNSLEENEKVVNVEFNVNRGSYEYMTDFDLGYLCDLVIPEMEINEQRRIICCYEVIKNNQWSLELELGEAIGGKV